MGGKKSFKYCTLVNQGNVAVSANADGGVVISTTGNKAANKPAKNVTSVVIKKNSRATFKSIRNTVRANNFRRIRSVPPSRRPPPFSSPMQRNKRSHCSFY